MGSYDFRDRPAYDDPLDKDTNPLDYQDTKIEKWWNVQHDKMLENSILEWQWQWYLEIQLEGITPPYILTELTTERGWYNKIILFAVNRVKELRLDRKIRKPKWNKCPLCGQKFVEDSLPHPFMRRLGVNQLDFCSPCLKELFFGISGNNGASKVDVIMFLRDLSNALQRIPSQTYGSLPDDFIDLSTKERLIVFKILKNRPTLERVKSLFGSWMNALIEANLLNEDAQRMSRGIKCLAKDGHVCKSLGEKTIDDFLHARKIDHVKEPSYPTGNQRADFRVKDILIEYFGLKGQPDYDKRMKEKQRICKENGIKMISIYPSDVVSNKKLETKLQPILGKPKFDLKQLWSFEQLER